jgi:hypothetical protein
VLTGCSRLSFLLARRRGAGRRAREGSPDHAARVRSPSAAGLHLDSKKLGRIRGLGHRMTGQRFHHFSGAGWEYLHVSVDDHSRVAYLELLPDEGQATARRFLRGALRWFADMGFACGES